MSLSNLSSAKAGAEQEVGRAKGGTADPSWPKAYSAPCDIVVIIQHKLREGRRMGHGWVRETFIISVFVLWTSRGPTSQKVDGHPLLLRNTEEIFLLCSFLYMTFDSFHQNAFVSTHALLILLSLLFYRGAGVRMCFGQHAATRQVRPSWHHFNFWTFSFLFAFKFLYHEKHSIIVPLLAFPNLSLTPYHPRS